jgi:sulfur transfer complex TusBCD TusB component (DsrH family)
MRHVLAEYNKLNTVEHTLFRWTKLYEEIETNYRNNAVKALENKQVSTNSSEYDIVIKLIDLFSDVIARGIDNLLACKEHEKKVYNAVKNFSNTLIKNQKDDYAYNMNEIEDIMTNLGYFLDDLEELYEDTKTNYNNLFMTLSDNDKQRYIKTLSVAFSETQDLSIKLGQPNNIYHDINTKIYTHTNNLLENRVASN